MHHEWGRLIVLYLFLGGLSAGTLILSGLATLSRRAPRIAAFGAIASPWPVLAGTGLLVLDLGQPFYFWKLLVAVQPRSPMWIGTWLLTVFSLISIPYAALFVPLPARWRIDRAAWRRRLAAAGIPVGAGVGLYTGVLLSVLVARPLWNTPLLAQLFLVSALSTGTALLIGLIREPGAESERHLLVAADVGLIAIELILIAAMFLAALTSNASAGAAIGLLLRGGTASVFWIAVVFGGLIVPLAIEVGALRSPAAGVAGTTRAFERVAAFLVLAGGFSLRWVLVAAGQASGLLSATR